MITKIKLTDFQNVLNKLKSGLSSGKQTTEQSDCFAFIKSRIWTYNDEISVSAPNAIDFEGAVSSTELLSLVSKLKGEELSIEQKGEELLLKANRVKAGIRIQKEVIMPVTEITIPKRWNKLPNNFMYNLGKCIFSASVDSSQILLTYIRCKKETVQSSDDERATRCFLSSSLKEDFLIPAASAKFLVMLDDVIHYKTDEDWVHFKTKDGVVFSSRKDDMSYPSLDKHFESDGFTFIFPDNTKDILERAGVFIETDFEQDKLVNVEISAKGVFKIRGEGDSGWIEETKRVKTKPKTNVSFSINPQYLQQILQQTNEATIGERFIWFNTDDFEHVVSLEG